MSLNKQLPELRVQARIGSVQFDTRPDAMERWAPDVRAAAEGDTTISMYDPIGEAWDGSGVTAKRISSALRAIGNKDVTVNLNSPGGDFFEGVAIYNLLRTHPAKVTVNVLGLAASAASVIAMAGDEVLMGDGAFLMIHNAWAVAMGNRHDMREAADMLEPFDQAMADVYAARSGVDVASVAAMMDKETWINASQAVADGFATGLLEPETIKKDASAGASKRALAMVETAMAKAGYSRNARRDAFAELFSDGTPCAAVSGKGTPRATQKATPCAGDDLAALLHSLNATIQSKGA
jgi:ATP-dependent Clp protease protease subunit